LEDLKLADNFLKDSMKVWEEDNSFEKVKKIASFLLPRLHEHRGPAEPFMDTLSEMGRYLNVISGKSKIYCGDFASIFSFFANRVGIPARYVAEESNSANVHSFCEWYSSENKKWIFTDLYSGALFVKDSSGNYLDAANVLHAHVAEKKSFRAEIWKNNKMKEMSYDSVKSFYNDYFSKNSRLVFYKGKYFEKDYYSLASKVIRYALPVSGFAIYDERNQISNVLFYVKSSMLWLLIGCLPFALFFLRRKKS
jgi:hypothetical protein